MKKTLSASSYFSRAKVFVYLLVIAAIVYLALQLFNVIDL